MAINFNVNNGFINNNETPKANNLNKKTSENSSQLDNSPQLKADSFDTNKGEKTSSHTSNIKTSMSWEKLLDFIKQLLPDLFSKQNNKDSQPLPPTPPPPIPQPLPPAPPTPPSPIPTNEPKQLRTDEALDLSNSNIKDFELSTLSNTDGPPAPGSSFTYLLTNKTTGEKYSFSWNSTTPPRPEFEKKSITIQDSNKQIQNISYRELIQKLQTPTSEPKQLKAGETLDLSNVSLTDIEIQEKPNAYSGMPDNPTEYILTNKNTGEQYSFFEGGLMGNLNQQSNILIKDEQGTTKQISFSELLTILPGRI